LVVLLEREADWFMVGPALLLMLLAAVAGKQAKLFI
jgi:hypothetical protein